MDHTPEEIEFFNCEIYVFIANTLKRSECVITKVLKKQHLTNKPQEIRDQQRKTSQRHDKQIGRETRLSHCLI